MDLIDLDLVVDFCILALLDSNKSHLHCLVFKTKDKKILKQFICYKNYLNVISCCTLVYRVKYICTFEPTMPTSLMVGGPAVLYYFCHHHTIKGCFSLLTNYLFVLPFVIVASCSTVSMFINVLKTLSLWLISSPEA